MHEKLREEWQAAVEKILKSPHRRKVVVAGPGAGKTSLFKKLLSQSRDSNAEAKHLVVTFINELTNELRRDLGALANVQTFHGYCAQALHKNPYLRRGLNETFKVYPKLPTLIKSDWGILMPAEPVPHFVDLMRRTVDDAATQFSRDRSNYYDAVSFDDMVFRVYVRLAVSPASAEAHDLILVDEYQDFNLLEVSLLDILARKSSVVFAGDDDQVLYGALRGSSWHFIRDLYAAKDTESCELPFCLRCPQVIVGAVDDIVKKAVSRGQLSGRIPKSFRYYPPVKEADSVAHPKIMVVRTSTQTTKANYFGRFVEYVIGNLLNEDIQKSRADGFPTVLVIGNKQYLRQISEHLRFKGYVLDERDPSEPGADDIARSDGLALLKDDPASRLGWRVVLEVDQPDFWSKLAPTVLHSPDIPALLPAEYREAVLADASSLAEEAPAVGKGEPALGKPTVKLTSFQGAKGLSAQHVIVAGLHNGDLPKNADTVADLEICKFLVALTRTRKRCYLLYATRFAGKAKAASTFIEWIDKGRRDFKYIDKSFWVK